MNGTFQTNVQTQPAPAEAGDFAGSNIRASFLAGPGELVAGPLGAKVGVFNFVNNSELPGAREANPYFTEGASVGFCHREQQALLTAFLEGAGRTVPHGYEVSLMNQGEYWALFAAGGATGAAVYALAASGEAIAGVPATLRTVGATATFNNTTLMNVTADGTPTGQFAVGSVITGPGVPAGTTIVSLGSGTGGTGTYNLNQAVNLGAGITINATYAVATNFTLASKVLANGVATGVIDATGLLTVSGGVTGTALAAGQYITGTGVPPGTYITAPVGGSGGNGTYQTNTLIPVTSTTMTFGGGLVGKISTWQA